MAITEVYANAATIGTTEYSLPNNSTSLATITTDGVWTVYIGASAIVAGDEYILRIYETVLAAGTKRQLTEKWFVGDQGDIWVSPSLMLWRGWDVTMQKKVGTDRSISWSIRRMI